MKRHFHSIEEKKKTQQLSFSQNARKSQWTDLDQLKIQKFNSLLTLAEMVSLYDRKDHEPQLQKLLAEDNRFQALIIVATNDIKNIKTRIEEISSKHSGKTGLVSFEELPEMLKLSEKYLSLDDLLTQLETSVVSELSEIFSASIQKVKQATH